jgi:hypothetical protein
MMKAFRTLLLAAIATTGTFGVAEAQTRYYAREILSPGATTPAKDTTTTPPQDPVYNTVTQSPIQRTYTINGCASSGLFSGFVFPDVAAALKHCASVKSQYPGWLYCSVTSDANGVRSATIRSSECAPTFETPPGPFGAGNGHYPMQRIAGRY